MCNSLRLALSLVAASLAAQAGVITINFSNQGTFTFTGPGALSGSNLSAQLISGTNTAANSGLPIACQTCQLNLTTGTVATISATTAATTFWLFNAGNTFELRGAVPAVGINDPNTVLLAGTVAGNNQAQTTIASRTGANYSYSASALTITSFNPAWLSFYGEASPTGGTFTASSTGPNNANCFNAGGTGPACDFSAAVQSASLQIITSAVPEPSTVVLGAAALGLLAVSRRRR